MLIYSFFYLTLNNLEEKLPTLANKLVLNEDSHESRCGYQATVPRMRLIV